MLKKFLKSRRQGGQSLIMLAVSLPILFMFIGASADFGWMYFNESRLQNAADAAVTAGAKVLIGDEQSASDYTYVTFVANSEEGLLKLMADDNRPTNRPTDAGDDVAAKYVAKNLSKENTGTYSGTWAYVDGSKKSGRKITLLQADAWNNNNNVNFESALYGTDDEDYKALYYVVTLEEPLYHLFGIMDNLGFENLHTKVMAVAKISHNIQRLPENEDGTQYAHGPSLYVQMKAKERAETYVDWDIIKKAHGSNTAADNRSVITAGAFYDSGTGYNDGKTFRTELAILDGYGMSFGKNYVDKNESIHQYEWDDLFIDFQGEMQNMSDYLDIDMARIFVGENQSKTQVYNTIQWDYAVKGYSGDAGNATKGDYRGNQPEYEFRVHYPLNINGLYPVRTNKGKIAPDPVYAFIEREPVRKAGSYKTYDKDDNDVWLSGRSNMSAVRQIIINNNIDNYKDSDANRPIIFFYEGPEPFSDDDKNVDVDKNKMKNSYDGNTYIGLRRAQPIILNLYADFRGILFAPKTPVAINGNGYNFEGFIVAADYVGLMQESDYVKIYYDGKECYAKKEDLATSKNEHKILEVEFQGKKYFVNEANTRKTYHRYQYQYEVTSGGGTYYVNNFYNLIEHEEFNPDSEENKGKYTKVYYWGHPYYVLNSELSTTLSKDHNYTVKLSDNTKRYINHMNKLNAFAEYSDVEVTYNGSKRYIPRGAIIYKVTEETVAYSGQTNRKATIVAPDTKEGKQSEINEGRTFITTKFKDNKGHENPIFVDFRGNVQYGDSIKPTAALAEGFQKDDPATTYKYNDQEFDTSDDFTFSGNPFNLGSVKYNSFYCVSLVDYTYLSKSESTTKQSEIATDAFYLTQRSKHID